MRRRRTWDHAATEDDADEIAQVLAEATLISADRLVGRVCDRVTESFGQQRCG